MSEPVGNSPRQPLGGNSHKVRAAAEAAAPEPREAIQPIVQGKVVQRKPNAIKRAARSMVADDVSNVREFVVAEVFVPAIRNLLFDIISQGSHRILYGTARGRSVGGINPNSGPVGSLKRAYHNASKEPERTISRSGAARHTFDEIVLDNHGEAVEVILSLKARVDRYNSASVADLYEYLGVSSDFTSQNWGWTNLDSADVRSDRRGFMLDLPQPVLLRSS